MQAVVQMPSRAPFDDGARSSLSFRADKLPAREPELVRFSPLGRNRVPPH